jgi:DNA-damage-inducible protein D
MLWYDFPKSALNKEDIMDNKNIVPNGQKSFEELKQINRHGAEYWSARDLQPVLGYSQWRRFEDAIQRAITSCQQSGNASEHHFAGVGKMIPLGKGGKRDVSDYHLSRFACYLIAQNGDPRKPEIANAQKYFAIQTRRQEISEGLAADMERLELRKQTSEEFRALSGAARDAGVQNKMFGVFHDAGYKGLYGGKGVEEIKRFKKIDDKDNLMDRMNTTELAANQFRMTQAREKLQKEKIKGQEAAIETHKRVGREVREAIRRIGGTPPEHIPPAEHIKQVEKRIEKAAPRLELENQDAKGLTGDGDEGN